MHIHLDMNHKSLSVCSEDDDVICVEDSIAPILPLHPLIRDDGPATGESTVAAKGHKHKKKRRRDPMEDSYYLHKLPPPVTVSWLSPNLRVRIISKDYCKGQYYNHKVSGMSCLSSKW